MANYYNTLLALLSRLYNYKSEINYWMKIEGETCKICEAVKNKSILVIQ